jgi:hypothetical protein
MISDKLQQCLDKMNQVIDQKSFLHREGGCDERTIERESVSFTTQVGRALDETYLALMSNANGVMFNGMVIFPLCKHAHRDLSIAQENEDLREHFSEDYLFYGNFDEELYCYHIPTEKYLAIEYATDSPWEQFASADEMFAYMIKRGLSSVGIED